MSPKTVIHIIPSLKIGGVENIVLSSVHAINQEVDYKIILFDYIDWEIWDKLDNRLKKHFLVFCSWHWLVGVVKVVFFLIKEKPSVVITSLWKSALIMRLTFLVGYKPKHIAFIHNDKPIHFADSFFLKWQMKNSNFQLADSEAVTHFITSIHKKATVQILPLLFSINAIDINEKQLNKPQRFCFIGRLAEQKNIEGILILIGYIKKKLPDSIFHFFGNDEGKLKLIENYAKAWSNTIQYKGKLMPWEVKSRLPLYDFIMLLSHSEGMAMSVVEAMQYGVVPIVSPVGEANKYCIHLENSIKLKSNKEKDIEESIDDIVSVCDDEFIYKKLSNKAYSTFFQSQKYEQVFTSFIKKII